METLTKHSTANNSVLKIIVTVLFIVMPFVGLYLGMQYQGSMTEVSEPPNTLIRRPTPTPKQEVDETATWKTYFHDGFPNFKKPEYWRWVGFKLYYPPGWGITENDRSEDNGSLLLTFKKEDGSYFRIVQGFGEGGRCLFPEEADYDTFQGMGSQYDSYIQIDKSKTIRWKLARYKFPDNLWSHSLCNFNFTNGFYSDGNANVVGIDAINLITEDSYNEFVEILKRLEITTD